MTKIGTRTVLIIGDDADTHALLGYALSCHGFQILTMPESRSALFPSDRIDTDLIIFDDLLPGTDGWNALPRIRSLSSVPIIALTRAGAAEVQIASLDRGADYCLIKPFDLKEFQARVRALMRRYDTLAHIENSNHC